MKKIRFNFLYQMIIDVIAILILSWVFMTLYPSVNVSLDKKGVVVFLWMLSPVVSFYLLFRLINLNSVISLVITLAVLYILDAINIKKIALTTSPISFSDLVESTNFSVAIHYLNFNDALLLVVLVLVIFFFYISRLFCKKICISNSCLYTSFLLVSFCVTSVFGYFPVISRVFQDNLIVKTISKYHNQFGINYITWDWNINIENVGLPYHLIQTSARKAIPKSNINDDKKFNILSGNLQRKSNKLSKNIIFILCEACWYSDEFFKSNFSPIINKGFREAKMIAPVYGGGTANSEFEVLTGLPSNSNLVSGVLYQEYAVSFSDNSLPITRYLSELGYNTYAAHNNTKYFYNRDRIFRKFGFLQYDGIEDMSPTPPDLLNARKEWQWQSDDWSLYNQALIYLEKHRGEKNFLHLINMSTHGPYIINNDNGEKAYSYQLNEAMSRLLYFVQKVEDIDPEAIVVIYGDHMPSLASFFYEKGVFTEDVFVKTGVNNEDFIFSDRDNLFKVIGSIPILIKGNIEHIDKLVDRINNKPLFCLPVIFDDIVMKINMPITQYAIDRCNSNEDFNYKKLSNSYEEWIYSNILFEN